METLSNKKGFRSDFLGKDLIVNFPVFPESVLAQLAQREDGKGYILDYVNYSVIQHSYRRLPIISASNIDGSKFLEISRKSMSNYWKLDSRIPKEYQLGSSLYKADKSDFDKGHMTKREDVQWGNTEEEAMEAAKSTFYYTNAVPQHARLNQRAWREVEDYILHTEAVAYNQRICMLTAPLLHDKDPDFVTLLDGDFIQLPTLFWKVIYFTKGDGNLYRVSFLYSQKNILEEEGIVVKMREIAPVDNLFMNFEHAKTYQVNTSVIEELTGFNFSPAIDPYTDTTRPTEIIVEEVNVRGGGKPEKYIRGIVL